jgi:hypothetical protein
MAGFERSVLDRAMREREVDLTVWGRKSGRPLRVTLWIWGDGEKLYVRAGGGFAQDWPRNLMATGEGILHLAGQEIPIRARLVEDPAEARQGKALIERKYGETVQGSREGEPLTPGEQATFELLPRTMNPGGGV